MISQLLIQMVKYAFGFPVVAMVSHIPVKSRMAVNYVNWHRRFDRKHRLLVYLHCAGHS